VDATSRAGNERNRRAANPALLVYEGGLQSLEFHPIANAFPLMEGDAFRELVEDVRKNGQQQPILTYEGRILDGRNRYRACLEAGEEPWTEPWQGKSPVEAVLSLNLHRRHLSSSQRAVVAERMLPHLEAEARKRKTGRPKSGEKVTQRIGEVRHEGEAVQQAARLTGTNREYVRSAAKLREEDPDALARVERGEATLSAVKKEREKPSTRPNAPTVGDVLAGSAGEDFEVLPRKLSPEQKAFYEISAYLVRLRRMDPEKVAEEWLESKDHFEAQQQTKDARYVVDWFSRYDAAIERISKLHRREAGNLRVVGEE
jgi:hypothetical protein